jgi:ankyrin repeat protein
MPDAATIIKAAKKNDVPTLSACLAANPALLHVIEPDGSTPLHCAAWKGNVAAVEALLDAGADIDAESQNDHYGTTPLHAAAHGNQKEVAAILIARGANLKAVNMHGRTPLDETAIHNATAVAKLLRAAESNG